ncbi:hypothetical protein GDO81_011568 [Engystomops pustulosus]|uniref:Uncharacterized protein n=1 Tax=Engystomops pustulosus TaxID=76066 RepID=A0AAV7BFN1_ENGPU|nr:hypothetical protein GDO81_011568 [Engystomops pustulosus]
MAPTPAAGKRGSAVSTAAPPPHVARGDPVRASQAAPSRHSGTQPDRQRGSPEAQQRQNKVAQQRQNEAAQPRQNETAQQRQTAAAQQRQNEAAQQRQNEEAQQRQNEAAQQRQNEAAQQRQNAAAQQRQTKGAPPQNPDQKGSPPHTEGGSPLHLKQPNLQHLQTSEEEHDPMDEGQFESEGQGRHLENIPLRSPQLPQPGEFVPGIPFILRSQATEDELSATPTFARYAAPSPEWASSPENFGTDEMAVKRPPVSEPLWHAHLQNLPTKEDFKSLIAEVKEAFRSEISEIRRDIQGMTQKIDHLEAGQADSRRQIAHTQHTLHSHSVTLQDMARHLEDLDNRGRRNNIRVRGLSEVEGKEDVHATLQALFSTLLGEPETQLYQDLSGITLQKRRILRPLLDILRQHDISYRWNFPFALSATKDGITATLSTMEELQEFCDIWNIPTPRLDDWGDLPPQMRQTQNKTQLQQKRRRPRTRAPSQDSYD